MKARLFVALALTALLTGTAGAQPCTRRGSAHLGIVVERAAGSLQLIETSRDTALCSIEGLGDLSHASAVFSRSGRFGFVFARNGGLSKVDLPNGTLVKRVQQAGNSIGGAISQNGRMVAVSKYEPMGYVSSTPKPWS